MNVFGLDNCSALGLSIVQDNAWLLSLWLWVFLMGIFSSPSASFLSNDRKNENLHHVALSLSLSFSMSVCLFVCLSISLYIFPCLYPPLSLSAPLSLCPPLALLLSISLALSLSLSLSLSFSLSLSLSLSLCESVFHFFPFLLSFAECSRKMHSIIKNQSVRPCVLRHNKALRIFIIWKMYSFTIIMVRAQ